MDYFENLWNDTFADFEDVFVLKTIINDVDLNFLNIRELEHISDIAYELGLELPIHLETDDPECPINSLDDLYSWQNDEIHEIFNKWNELINGKYLALKRDLFSLAITGENG